MSADNKRYCYRTTDAEVFAVWEQWQKDMNGIFRKARAFIKRHLPDTDAKPAVVEIWGDAVFDSVEWRGDPPEGWRWTKRYSGRITPRLSTKEGKALAAEMGALTVRDIRRHVPGAPMPDVFRRPGMSVIDGVMWIESYTELHVDARWTPEPYSALVLALEAADDKENP